MAILIGDKSRFAVEIGEFYETNPSVRRVDLWVAGRWVTCDDNWAFIPQFCGSVGQTITRLQQWGALPPPFPDLSPAVTHRRLLDDDDEIRWRFGFADWGPTTDNVTSHIFHAGEGCAITLEFCRATHHDPAELGAVLVAEFPEGELVQMLTQALALLESGAE